MDSTIKETGVFCMEVVHQILKAETIEAAKVLAEEAVKEYAKKITQENVRKVKNLVKKCKCQRELAFGMSNFILAFQGERVIK